MPQLIIRNRIQLNKLFISYSIALRTALPLRAICINSLFILISSAFLILLLKLHVGQEKYKMFDDVDFKAFKVPITSNLINNLTIHTCSVLSNILAIDYVTRLNSKPSISEYVGKCIAKLKSFLGQRVITDDSFSTAMTLFAVAIAEEPVNYNDKNNLIKHTQDAAIDILINEHFKDYNLEDKKKIQLILKELLNSENRNEILNHINYDPHFIKTIINNALQISTRQVEINNYVKNTIKDVLDRSIKLKEKINFIKESASKIVTGVCALAAGALSIVTAGAALSMVIVPASIVAMKYAPKLGEKIGGVVASLNNNITEEKQLIYESKTLAIQNAKESIERFELSKMQNINQAKDLVSVNDIKEQLSSYISSEPNEQSQNSIKPQKGFSRNI
jgi:hypothetical protein